MGSNFASIDGHCTERLIAYYEERARGGTGLLILETAAVSWPAGATMPNTIGFSADEFLPGLRELTTRVHSHGARIAAQLNHGGKVAQEETAAGRPVLVPSKPKPAGSDMFGLLTQSELANFVKAAGPDGRGPRYQEMTQDDIDGLVTDFADAADRAREAGFDAIEIHAGHGYVLSSFLSPASNRREDDYGGSIENRARLLLDVIAAVRQRVGAQFPILVRLDAQEYRVDGGIRLEDCIATAKLVEAAGVDAVDVSAYGNTAKGIAFTEAPLVHEPGGFLGFARAVKSAIGIPVIAVGRIEADVGERGIAAGDFDFVAMGRKLLADPELPNKLAAGATDDIRPCIYCYVCVSQIFINQPMCCAVNPATGREQELNIIASDSIGKKVLVIGGGPGGMEAARTLALRGHQVRLWEKEKDLGGTARIAALPYAPNGQLVDYLKRSVKRLPIDIRTGNTADLESIVAAAPDAVILATGAIRQAPDIRGKDQRHVFDGDQLRGLLFGSDPRAVAKLSPFARLLLTLGRISQLLRSVRALRLLSHLWMPIAREVVVIGGGLVGLELAEYLVERGRRVTVLEPSNALGAELSIVRRTRVIHMLREHGATLLTNADIREITADAVVYSNDGQSHQLPCKQVIIAMGARGDTSMADALRDRGIDVSTIGDCRSVNFIEGAILDARKTALTI
jgi:2,4-dienoyl-CoA reductase (NADPH2)